MAKKKKTRKIKRPLPRKKRPKARKNKPLKPARVSLPPKNNNVDITEPKIHRTKFRLIGIGGGAGTIISEIKGKIKKMDFVIANTDSRALKGLRGNIKKFPFGQSLTSGLGTGMDASLGEAAANNEKEKIKKTLENQDLVIMIACLGGGTSSGATPVFAKMAKDLGVLTYGIFTLPFQFEGAKKMEMAIASLQKIKPYLNAYSVIPNERIFQIIDKNTPLQSALSTINKRLAENLGGLIEMICLPGLINIDFADLKTILEGRGRLAYLNTITIENADKEEAIQKVISSSLYPYTIKGARGILYDIGGGKELQLSEVSDISKIISKSVNPDAKIIFGIGQDRTSQNQIKITIFATGCGTKFLKQEPPTTIVKNILGLGKKKKPEKISKPLPHKSRSKPKKQKPRGKPKGGRKAAKAEKSNVKKEKTAPEKNNIAKSEANEPKISFAGNIASAESAKAEAKIRRNALQIRKVAEEEEKKLLEQEKVWDQPAIFRKKQIHNS